MGAVGEELLDSMTEQTLPSPGWCRQCQGDRK